MVMITGRSHERRSYRSFFGICFDVNCSLLSLCLGGRNDLILVRLSRSWFELPSYIKCRPNVGGVVGLADLCTLNFSIYVCVWVYIDRMLQTSMKHLGSVWAGQLGFVFGPHTVQQQLISSYYVLVQLEYHST
jgi:hypothetical protein